MNNETAFVNCMSEQIYEMLTQEGLKPVNITRVGNIKVQLLSDKTGTIAEISGVCLKAELENDPDTKFIALMSPESAEDLANELLEYAAQAREENGDGVRQ